MNNLNAASGEVQNSTENLNPAIFHLPTSSEWEGRTVDARQNELLLRQSLGLTEDCFRAKGPELTRFRIPSATQPLSLKSIKRQNNIYATGCYLTSVIDLMLSQTHLRHQFFAEMLKVSQLKGNLPLTKPKTEKPSPEKESKVSEEASVAVATLNKETLPQSSEKELQNGLSAKTIAEEMRKLQLDNTRDPELKKRNKERHAELKKLSAQFTFDIYASYQEYKLPNRLEIERIEKALNKPLKILLANFKPNPIVTSSLPKQIVENSDITPAPKSELKPEICTAPSLQKDPLTKNLEAKQAILKALLDLVMASSEGQVALGGEAIRQAIFASEFHYELNLGELYEEHDAAAVLRVLMNDILDQSFQTIAVDTIVDGLTFKRPIQNETFISLPISEGNLSLAATLAYNYSEMLSQDTRKFEIEGKKEDHYFNTKTQFMSLPETMAIQLLRFDYNGKKNDELTLPADGIVDFAPFYAGTESDSCKYEITGLVQHAGSERHTGHYTALVKIGNKFFMCDDVTSTFKEINPADFYGNTNSYLILLKKIPTPVEKIVAKRSRESASQMV